MANKDVKIAMDSHVPVILINDSPECQKLSLISSKNSVFIEDPSKFNQEKDRYSTVDIDSGTVLKEMDLDDDYSIIELSSSPSFNTQDIAKSSLMDRNPNECSEVKDYYNTLSILSTVDDFSLNIMKSTSMMDSKSNSNDSKSSCDLRNDNNLTNHVVIDQKILENTRKRVEKKRISTLKSVNKLKTSKKECIKEMIVNVDTNILSSSMGPILSGLLENASCEYTEWSSPIPNLIFWKRKVIAEYDENLGYFVPVPETIRSEKFILVYIKASELLKLESDSCVDELVKRLTDEFPDLKIIFMIESIDTLFKKIKNDRNRRYVDAMRTTIETKNSENIFIPSEEIEEKIENILLRLQLIHNVFIVNTSSVENSAEWIFILTGDISTIPYKRMKLELSTSFCMESGQIKTGSDVKDTYTKLLQTIYKVTPQIANIIVEKYPKISDLVSAFRENGPDALTDLTIGKLTKRKIGRVLSKRIFHAFMTSDSAASAI
ncbi:hypothetical protein PNEG_01259 [Pneumocystis murina B123]|uniref:ERCC4 domain-containing protein n=1 Tax=Pneumocystis murina (strain B123) TaxID=1069680 RepID=M7NPB5_PNEMU|nr:hypothetical protein PNEG_01259 [Pneumocystis murina B123]EMR10553.1 hypothetical protein PNEG_01259 [Pneumocystis murina B123]